MVDVTDDEVEILFSKTVSGTTKRKSLIVDGDGIYIRDGTGAKKNLFDLF